MEKAALLRENKELKRQLAQANAELKEMRRLMFSGKTERHVPADTPEQLRLDFGAGAEESAEEVWVKSEQITYTRNKKSHPKRKPLPDHLPVDEIIIEPSIDTKGLKKIGEDIVDKLDYRPGSLRIKRYIFPKYAVADGKGIQRGRIPVRPVPKIIAESGLLAHLISQKFIYHLPFYRQIEQLKDLYKVKLARSSVNDWFAACCTLMEPLYERLKKKILESSYLQVDESPIQVQDENKVGKTHRGYQWVYSAPRLGLVLFEYQKGRGSNGPKKMLENYEGYVQTDGYGVYDKICKAKPITLLGCMAHCRRYFIKAKDSDGAKAQMALHYFRQLYAIERQIKESGLDNDQTRQIRQENSKQILEALYQWAEGEKENVLPKSPMGKAFYYLQQQWPKLKVFLEDGQLEIDNNLVENSIRPLALGRKNYLFAGSHPAAQRIAMMYSFFGTCQRHQVNPYEWLKATLERLPEHPINKIEELLPGKWVEQLEA